MTHTAKSLLKHEHLNPQYFTQMKKRKDAQRHNSLVSIEFRSAVPKQPSRYVPHYGKKEAAKYAARAHA